MLTAAPPARHLATEHGDRPRPLPDVKELKQVTEVFQCTGQKWWDYDPVTETWGWTRPPPESRKPTGEVRALARRLSRCHE